MCDTEKEIIFSIGKQSLVTGGGNKTREREKKGEDGEWERR